MNNIEKPLISICIPTYNRSEFLQNTLKSIKNQKFPLSYELIVTDNCSDDDTKSVFDQESQNHPNWFYYKNDSNVGGKKNIRLCTENSNGDYIYILGDDDYLLDDAFEHITNLIALAQDSGSNAILCNQRLKIQNKIDVLKNSFNWFHFISINEPAFISSVIWQRDIWLNYPYFSYPQEMGVPQLDCFIDACLNGKIVVSSRVLVSAGAAVQKNKEKSINYWFAPRHAISDLFEYPYIYTKVLKSNELSLKTRVFVELRRISLLREIFKKLIVVKANESYYEDVNFLFTEIHGDSLYGFIVLFLRFLVNKTFIGEYFLSKGEYPIFPKGEKINLKY